MTTNERGVFSLDAKEGVLPGGTVIVQRISYWAQYVGVICDADATHLLSGAEIQQYKNDPGQYYITLALNHFSETRPYRGNGSDLFRVPRFTLGPKHKTVLVILNEEELPLQREFCSDGYDTKKDMLTLEEAVFHHTESQCLTLELIWLLRQYLSGVGQFEVPSTFQISEKTAERYFEALQKALTH